MTRLWLLLAVLLAAPAQACSGEELFSLIAQRLSYMPSVARFKYQNSLPVEDLQREEVVLQQSLAEAAQLGLPAQIILPFMQAQMEAAKVIQRRVLLQLAADQRSVPDADLIATIRPQLGELGRRQLQAMQCMRERGIELGPQDRPGFDRQIQPAGLPPAVEDEIFRSLLGTDPAYPDLSPWSEPASSAT